MHLAKLILSEGPLHGYGPVLGNPELRNEDASVGAQYTKLIFAAGEVGITAKCNLAFCAAIASLAAPGDEVILPSPYYFNGAYVVPVKIVECRFISTGCGAFWVAKIGPGRIIPGKHQAKLVEWAESSRSVAGSGEAWTRARA